MLRPLSKPRAVVVVPVSVLWMSDWTGKPFDQIVRDFDRNRWLFAEEAVEYGCADKMLSSAMPVAHSPEDL